MTPAIVQIAIGLIGALLGIAVTWGSQRRTIEQLSSAVEKLTAKIELLSALERADALHSQEAAHQREAQARLEARIDRLEARLDATPHAGPPALVRPR